MWENDIIHKPEEHSELCLCRKNRATAIGSMYRKSREVWALDMRFLRYANGQTDTLIAILRTVPGGEVITLQFYMDSAVLIPQPSTVGLVDARPCNVFVVLRRVRNSRTIIIIIKTKKADTISGLHLETFTYCHDSDCN